MPGPSDIPTPLPWAHVETLPGLDPGLVARWRAALAGATTEAASVRSGIGLALATYWDEDRPGWRHARSTTETLVARARAVGDPSLVATALLGQLYATWGPDSHAIRRDVVRELLGLVDDGIDDEVRSRAHEWWVLDALDHGDLDAAEARIAGYRTSIDPSDVLARRRRELWNATIDMNRGRIDRSLRRYRTILPLASPRTGAPVSFQDGAVAAAIEWYLRSQGPELEEAVRAIIRNDARVEHTWQAGLGFLLAETGRLDAARVPYRAVTAGGLDAIPRDLNWLVAMWLITFTAAGLGDRARLEEASALLEPHAELDVTHGAGYASYGPVARALARSAVVRGDTGTARRHLEFVLDTRAPGPWTELARYELGTLPGPSRSRSSALLADAGAAFRGWGMDPWAGRCAAALAEETRARGGAVATLSGQTWHLAFEHEEVRIADGVGMRHLVALIERPHHPVSAVALDTRDGVDDSAPADVDDPQAVAAYRDRLDQLDVGSARDGGTAEATALRLALSRSRHRPSTSREADKARVRVTRALRRTIVAIGEEAPRMRAHLDAAISTGRVCSYEPVDGDRWHVVRLDRIG